MNNNSKTIPKFSVIISVYNAEETLAHAIENLVFQTFDDLEIIIVDKASTDRSKEIARLYEKNFSKKIKVFDRPYSNGPAAGRNFGISVAKAEYIAFCDADDYYDIQAFEHLNSFLLSHGTKYDIICYNTALVRNGELVRLDSYYSPPNKINLLLGDNCFSYWNKIVKKSLFLECGDIFDCLLDDIGYIPFLITNSKKIGFLNKSLYFHELSGGASNNSTSFRSLELLQAIENVFNNISPKYLGPFVVTAASRVTNYINTHWVFKDIYIKWLQEHRAYFVANKYLARRTCLNQTITSYIENYNEIIPAIIYFNGFGENNCLSNVNNVWVYGTEQQIIILNESNCNINENESVALAYQKKMFNYVAEYFAVKNICQTGGFYIGSSIVYGLPINCLRIFNAVFSVYSSKKCSDHFFGSVKNSDCINKLFQTYRINFYDDIFLSIGERIKNILFAVYDFEQITTKCIKNNICLSGADETLFDIKNNRNIFTHDFSDKYNDNDYLILPKYFIEEIYQNNFNKIKISNLSLRKQLNDINNSDSYKLVKHLKKFGNTKVGGFFKKIFKWFLKKYRHVKYGM